MCSRIFKYFVMEKIVITDKTLEDSKSKVK